MRRSQKKLSKMLEDSETMDSILTDSIDSLLEKLKEGKKNYYDYNDYNH